MEAPLDRSIRLRLASRALDSAVVDDFVRRQPADPGGRQHRHGQQSAGLILWHMRRPQMHALDGGIFLGSLAIAWLGVSLAHGAGRSARWRWVRLPMKSLPQLAQGRQRRPVPLDVLTRTAPLVGVLISAMVLVVLFAGCGEDSNSREDSLREVDQWPLSAAYANDVAAARRLIEAAADVNAKNESEQSACLISTSEVGNDPRLLELALDGARM